MTSTRLKTAACALAGLTLSACSTADLEMFNAGLEMYNGVTYYDVTNADEPYNCGSGQGYMLRHSGVRSNQQYVYFTSHSPRQVEVTLTVSDEVVATYSIPPYSSSELYWTYPSYTVGGSFIC